MRMDDHIRVEFKSWRRGAESQLESGEQLESHYGLVALDGDMPPEHLLNSGRFDTGTLGSE